MFDDKLARLNGLVAKSVVGRYFRLRGSGCPRSRDTDFSTEVQAGITAFLALAYIIGLNAAIVAESGGSCVCSSKATLAADLHCKTDTAYLTCKKQFQRDVAAATSVVTGIGSVLMGVLANLPIELSCGIGSTVYFVYNMVGYHGSGSITYSNALGAVFFEGLIFILLTMLGVRQWLAKLLPASLKHAACVGLGLFICFIGMREDIGIGLISSSPMTFVTLGGCKPESRDPVTQACPSEFIQSPTTLLGLAGVLLMTILTMFRVRGAILIGILIVSVVSWIRHTPFTYFPDNSQVSEAAYQYFASIVDFHTLRNTMALLTFDIFNKKVAFAMATMLYIDLLDTAGTIFTHAAMMDMVDEEGDFDGATAAFLCDGATISIGSLFGVPPVTALLDSGIGITEGGRTGIVAVVAGVLFFLSTILAPIFTSFPPWATGPSLIMVGVLMARNATMIPWEFPGEAVPAFLTITIVPLSFSVVDGILIGILSYISIHTLARLITFTTHGSLVPISPPDNDDYNLNDRRVSTLPPWISALKAHVSRWFQS